MRVRFLVALTAVAACTGGNVAPVRPSVAVVEIPPAVPERVSEPVPEPPPPEPAEPDPPKVRFVTRLGDAGEFKPSGLVLDPAGNIFLAGSMDGSLSWGSTSFASFVLTNYGTPQDYGRSFIGKLDPLDKPLWARLPEGSGGDEGTPPIIAAGRDGSVAFVGRFNSMLRVDRKVLDSTKTSGSSGKVFVTSLDAQGALRFARAFINTPDSSITSADVAVDAEGNIIVVGEFDGWPIFDTRLLKRTSPTSVLSVFVAKLNRFGTLQWVKEISAMNWAQAHAVAADASSTIYVGGDFEGSLKVGTVTLEGSTQTAGFVVALSPNGLPLWGRAFADPKRASVRAVATGPGGVAVSVAFAEGLLTPLPLVQVGETNAAIFKLDGQGQVLWGKTVGGDATANAVTVAPDGGVVFCGSARGPFPFGANGGRVRQGPSVYVASLSADGSARSAKVFGAWGVSGDHDSRSSSCRHLALRPSGSVVATGTYRGKVEFGKGLYASESRPRGFLVELDL